MSVKKIKNLEYWPHFLEERFELIACSFRTATIALPLFALVTPPS
jgi:hypothetical protein